MQITDVTHHPVAVEMINKWTDLIFEQKNIKICYGEVKYYIFFKLFCQLSTSHYPYNNGYINYECVSSIITMINT